MIPDPVSLLPHRRRTHGNDTSDVNTSHQATVPLTTTLKGTLSGARAILLLHILYKRSHHQSITTKRRPYSLRRLYQSPHLHYPEGHQVRNCSRQHRRWACCQQFLHPVNCPARNPGFQHCDTQLSRSSKSCFESMQ